MEIHDPYRYHSLRITVLWVAPIIDINNHKPLHYYMELDSFVTLIVAICFSVPFMRGVILSWFLLRERLNFQKNYWFDLNCARGPIDRAEVL